MASKLPRSLRAGLPLVIFSVGGLYMMSHFVTIKYEKLDKQVSKDSIQGAIRAEDYKMIVKQFEQGDVEDEDYEIVPIPRPEEDDDYDDDDDDEDR